MASRSQACSQHWTRCSPAQHLPPSRHQIKMPSCFALCLDPWERSCLVSVKLMQRLRARPREVMMMVSHPGVRGMWMPAHACQEAAACQVSVLLSGTLWCSQLERTRWARILCVMLALVDACLVSQPLHVALVWIDCTGLKGCGTCRTGAYGRKLQHVVHRCFMLRASSHPFRSTCSKNVHDSLHGPQVHQRAAPLKAIDCLQRSTGLRVRYSSSEYQQNNDASLPAGPSRPHTIYEELSFVVRSKSTPRLSDAALSPSSCTLQEHRLRRAFAASAARPAGVRCSSKGR